MIREWQTDENALQYEERDGKAAVLQWKGTGITARIPEEIDGIPVAAVGRKAFLSDKRVQEVWLPDSVEEIGDWAFAYCSRLVSVRLPGRRIAFGKGVFFECERLERIMPDRRGSGAAFDAEKECIANLLAAVVHKMDAPYLLDIAEAGSAHWIEKWDAKLVQTLNSPNREGFSKTLLCGEEDYGSKENNLDYFLSQKRRGKVRLALLRLLHDKGLPDGTRRMLADYLRAHTKGCVHEEAWQVVKEEYGTRREYYDLLMDIGALTADNFDAALRDMGTELAEMKAYLLREKDMRFGNGGFFDSLSLEL